MPKSGLLGLENAWSAIAVLFFAILTMYSLFPSESSQERFTIIFRLGVLATLALVFVARYSVTYSALKVVLVPLFLVVLSLSVSNFPFYPSRTLNVLATVMFSALIASVLVLAEARKLFVSALDFLLIFSALAVLLQIGVVLLGGGLIEAHQFFFPWSESRSAELVRYGITRVSGLHTEPGTHSAYTVGLLIVRGLCGRPLFDRVGWLAMVSVLVTLSFWGVMAFLGYALAYTFMAGSVSLRGRFYVLGCIGGFLLLGGVATVLDMEIIHNIQGYFAVRAQLDDGSGGAKVSAWDAGSRLLAEVAFIGLPFGSDYCGGCRSPQDAGIILNVTVYFGLLFAIIFGAIYLTALYRGGGMAALSFGSVFFLGKFFYYDPIVWLIFFLSVVAVFNGPSVGFRVARSGA